MVFGEDNRRFDKRAIAKNESTMRRLALNCIKKAQVYVAKALNLKDITLSAARKVLIGNDELLAKYNQPTIHLKQTTDL